MSDEFERHQRFPTTQWTLVGRAGLEFDERRREALDQLLRRYWAALRAHLIAKRRLDVNEADDLVQGFIENKVLEKNLVAHADRDRGKFRTLLATALDNYVANEIQKRGAKKRLAERAGQIDEALSPVVADDTRPEETLDITWAREVLAEVISRMRSECDASQRKDLWVVFHGRILAPIFDGGEEMSYEEVIQQCGFKSPTQASNALVTAKRMFVRCLKTVVAEYAMHADDIDTEIQELEAILARTNRRD